MRVYHGSDHIVEQPVFSGGRWHNDYGPGFYMTESLELAKEWACASGSNGYANTYELDLTGLKVLNLNSAQFSILNWLALLTKYRSYWQRSSIAEKAKEYLQEHFFIDPDSYDVVRGYRADDSYFSFAQDFVAGTISLRKLSEAMRLGELGEQVVLKSRESYNRIRFLSAEPAEGAVYYEKKRARDQEARRSYRQTRSSADSVSELFMLDIMREGMTADDPRLR